jgi:hypothetical protein
MKGKETLWIVSQNVQTQVSPASKVLLALSVASSAHGHSWICLSWIPLHTDAASFYQRVLADARLTVAVGRGQFSLAPATATMLIAFRDTCLM